jgi:hypothetical protein
MDGYKVKVPAGSSQRSIFQWYAVINLEEVLASNYWWNKHTEDDWINETWA